MLKAYRQVSEENLCRIAEKLVGISVRDLTKAEEQICQILIECDILTKSTSSDDGYRYHSRLIKTTPWRDQ